ncbi:hypothetical protein DNHGIG_07940 [Collibacillus ludicampi]|uniref:Uncharacterized protein n=1 Tax=Collibacillus ludicampi TaxID=2771369 RepID=A0AAV4LBS5_9BACL|nr:hypothetical protein [Collibacillus ludicampi]GIM45245.1 hypothetical protein DNHGIG_07940 [Collibacillus ludicampi]
MPYTTYLDNTFLNLVFGGTGYTPPATLYVGLSTTTPTTSGGNITEPSGNGYARVAVANNPTNWPAASNGSKSNGTAITFPAATGPWGTVTYFFIADAPTGGNVLGYGALTAAQTINQGDTLSFAAGALTVSMS